MKTCLLILVVLATANFTFAQSYSETNKVFASDPSAGDQFGQSTSISGNYAVVGAYRNFDSASEAGSAYVFKRDTSSGLWTFMQKLSASDGAAEDWFAWSVSIDGNRIVVGAYQADVAGPDRGAAYIFELFGNSWVEVDKITASDGEDGDGFGVAVGISGDDVIVGAPGDDDFGDNTGAIYYFKFNGTDWVEQSKLYVTNPANDDFFGGRLDISDDVFITAIPSDNEAAFSAGAAFIFEKSLNNWTQTAKLMAYDAEVYDDFGYSVAISGDIAIVGDYRKKNPWTSTGAAYVFTKSGSLWLSNQKLSASDKADGDEFGWNVGISGNQAIVGARAKTPNLAGGAYIYTFNGTWTETHILEASDSDTGDRFGYSVDISGDNAIVGAIGVDVSGSLAGAAYFFGEFNDANVLDLDGELGLQIYPNPTRDNEVRIKNVPYGTELSVLITDANGRLISEQTIINGKEETVFLDVIPGIYYVHLKDGESVSVKKIVKF